MSTVRIGFCCLARLVSIIEKSRSIPMLTCKVPLFILGILHFDSPQRRAHSFPWDRTYQQGHHTWAVDKCQMQNKLNYNHPPAPTGHTANKHLLVATKHSLVDHLQKIKTLDQLS